MSLADIARDDVEAAVAEFDQLGRDRILDTYGFGRSRKYVVSYHRETHPPLASD